MMGRCDCQKKSQAVLRLYSRRLCKVRGQRRGPQNGVSASALQKRREETGEHPRDSQEEQAVKRLSHGEQLQTASTRGSQEEAGWFRARHSGKENTEYRTNAAQGLWVPGKNTQ